tara:strand:- start:452 stop:589 length:138 start_codon:yes stop_codon:yes gene_type:complete
MVLFTLIESGIDHFNNIDPSPLYTETSPAIEKDESFSEDEASIKQ